MPEAFSTHGYLPEGLSSTSAPRQPEASPPPFPHSLYERRLTMRASVSSQLVSENHTNTLTKTLKWLQKHPHFESIVSQANKQTHGRNCNKGNNLIKQKSGGESRGDSIGWRRGTRSPSIESCKIGAVISSSIVHIPQLSSILR